MKYCPVCEESYETTSIFCALDGAVLDTESPADADSLIDTLKTGPDRIIGGKYRLERLLGRGGMGEVHLARHLDCNYHLAVKLLYKHENILPAIIDRFRREAQIAAMLKHPNTVWVFDFGEEPDFFFLAMEYVEGKTLRDVLLKEKRITEPDKLTNHCRQMGAALSAIHAANIVHRDLKPENVMLMKIDGIENLRVLDFGIAYAMDALRLTPTGGITGTLTYMAPEQLNGEATPRTDVYAMAAIFYELLTGNWVYVPQPLTELRITQAEVVNKILYENPVHPNDNADFPSALSGVILRGLAKNPDHRQPTVNDFVNDFLSVWNSSVEVSNQKMHNSQSDVFLGFAEDDRAIANEIAGKMGNENVTVEMIKPENFDDEANALSDIAGKIENSQSVILLCSDAALRSRLVKQVMQIAWKTDKPILPVQVAPVSFSEQMDFWLEGQKPIQVYENSGEAWLSQIVTTLKPQTRSIFRGLGAAQASFKEAAKPKARDLSGLIRAAGFTDQIWVVPADANQTIQPTVAFRGLGAPQPAAIHRIRVGDSVHLTLELEREGYLLLLNEGAENIVYCLCPSLFVPNERLAAGRHFFPQPESPYASFVISGTSGREKLLAIITDKPLNLGWMTADKREPARILSEDDKSILISVLRNLDVRAWTALATYFDVSN